MLAAGREGFRQFRAIGVLAALYLDVLGTQLPGPTIEIDTDGLLLCFQAEAACPLAIVVR